MQNTFFESQNEKNWHKETAVYWDTHLSYKLDLNRNLNLPN